MLSIDFDPEWHDTYRQPQRFGARLLALNGLRWLLALAALAALFFFFGLVAADQSAGYANCLSIADPSERLACYDKLAQASAPQPAKGARAPVRIF